MEAEKVRNLTDAELKQEQRDAMEQLFRLKFQMKMGQTESLKKIRGLRRGVARLKTIARERELGIETHRASAEARGTEKSAAAQPVKKAAAPSAKAHAKTKAKTAKAHAKTHAATQAAGHGATQAKKKSAAKSKPAKAKKTAKSAAKKSRKK